MQKLLTFFQQNMAVFLQLTKDIASFEQSQLDLIKELQLAVVSVMLQIQNCYIMSLKSTTKNFW